MKRAILYHPGCNFKIPIRPIFHKFDGEKYERAYNLVRKNFSGNLEQHTLRPASEISTDDILAAHTPAYIESLGDSKVVAKIIESRLVKLFPPALLDRRILSPMRYAVAGTVMAMEKVLKSEYDVIYNFGGGFHHAFPDHGEGFCVYNDLAIGIHRMQRSGLLTPQDTVGVVDLDAHIGNGNLKFYYESRHVEFLDIFNFRIYGDGIPYVGEDNPIIPLQPQTDGITYMQDLKEYLPPFLDTTKPRFVFYLAGTDVIKGDKLGKLALTPDDVFERDMYVITETARRRIPLVIVTAGGYTKHSHKLIAKTALAILENNMPGADL